MRFKEDLKHICFKLSNGIHSLREERNRELRSRNSIFKSDHFQLTKTIKLLSAAHQILLAIGGDYPITQDEFNLLTSIKEYALARFVERHLERIKEYLPPEDYGLSYR